LDAAPLEVLFELEVVWSQINSGHGKISEKEKIQK